MVRKTTLVQYVSHCQRKNSKAFVRPAGKLRNRPVTTPLCRFRVPSGSKEKGGRFGAEATKCCCRGWSIPVDGGGADLAAGSLILIPRPSGQTERLALDPPILSDLAEAVDFGGSTMVNFPCQRRRGCAQKQQHHCTVKYDTYLPSYISLAIYIMAP